MRSLLLGVAMLFGCGLQHDAPSPSECDHLWGNPDPSGYMASACCRTQQDCIDASQSGYYCTPPGIPLPFGNCPQSECTVDAECRATNPTAICQTLSCDPSRGMCVGGCTNDAGCGAGEACDLTTNRCHPAACAHPTDCPTNFSCTGGACARTTCASDSDCDGYCVLGSCYTAAGECRGPVG